METKDQVLALIRARQDQMKAAAKDCIRELRKVGGLVGFLTFLEYMSHLEIVDQPPPDILIEVRRFAFIAMWDLLTEDNGKFYEELIDLPPEDDPSKDDVSP